MLNSCYTLRRTAPHSINPKHFPVSVTNNGIITYRREPTHSARCTISSSLFGVVICLIVDTSGLLHYMKCCTSPQHLLVACLYTRSCNTRLKLWEGTNQFMNMRGNNNKKKCFLLVKRGGRVRTHVKRGWYAKHAKRLFQMFRGQYLNELVLLT